MLALATKLKITQGYNIRLCHKKKKKIYYLHTETRLLGYWWRDVHTVDKKTDRESSSNGPYNLSSYGWGSSQVQGGVDIKLRTLYTDKHARLSYNSSSSDISQPAEQRMPFQKAC